MAKKSKSVKGRGRPKGSKNKGAMQKTTARGAYKKPRVKMMAKRRAPLVETKQRKKAEVSLRNASTAGVASASYPFTINTTDISNASSFTLLNLTPFTRMSQGLSDSQMIGRSIFSKNLKLKCEFQYPEGTDIVVHPQRTYLICGWVTVPTAFTSETTPTEANATMSDIRTHLVHQLQELYNQKEDSLRFLDKKASNYRIESYRRIKPNLNTAIAPAPNHLVASTAGVGGAVPLIRLNHTWKINRKVFYTEGKSTATGNDATDPDIENYYPNNQQIPFAIIYAEEFAKMLNAEGNEVKMTIRYNVNHEFTDS